MIATLRQLRDVVVDGVRCALFLPPGPRAFDVGLGVTLILCALHLVASLILTVALWRGQLAFDADGLSADFAAYAVLLLCFALVPLAASRLTTARVFVGAIATGLPCSLAAAGLTEGLVQAFGSDAAVVPYGVFWLYFAWLPLALLRMVVAMAERWRWPTAAGVVAASLLAYYALPYRSVLIGVGAEQPASLLKMAASFLQGGPADPASVPSRPRLDAEGILFRQPALLGERLSALRRPLDDQPNLYVVSMAPFAEQDVFKREAIAVQSLFDTRFSTAGRSLLLINHRDTVHEHPLATMTNLKVSLREIGRLMRRDRDVLVLFVTSHGLREELSVEFPGFPLNTMTAQRLSAALDEAQIQNRVLIISACYSGSFVAPLRNQNTLILTAAHADRTSFGCSNENEWTYFGDAYFNIALRSESSFIAAFDKAKETISIWEKRDGLEPSQPQMFLGDAIAARLDALPKPTTAVR